MFKHLFALSLTLISLACVAQDTTGIRPIYSNPILNIADSTELWYLPAGTNIKVGVAYIQKYVDSSQMVIFPYTKYEFECGTWEKDSTSQAWPDSLKDVNWVYSQPKLAKLNQRVVGVRSCPCGCPPNETWLQQRIDPISGKLEERIFAIIYKYSKDPDNFQKVLKLHEPKKE